MGRLPDGVQYTFFDQNVRISGTPQEAGTFRFSITVSIFDTREDSNDGTCFGDNTTSEEYVIVIQP